MLTLIAIMCLLFHLSNCCTEFRLKAKQDGPVLVGRTMEFAVNLESNVVVEPKHMKMAANVPKHCRQKMTWRNKYSYVYFDALHSRVYGDGMNQAGLSASALYLPGFTQYQKVGPHQCEKAISCLQLVGWLLGNFGSVQEVRDVIKRDAFPRVWGEVLKGHLFDLHYSIMDKTGKGIIIEFTKKGRKVHENKLGVMTNAPTYDFHLLNMKNYIHLSKYARNPLKLGEMTFTATGQGNGLLGVPGDLTPPSRFVRTAAMVHFSKKPRNWKEAYNLAFHIINTVDIPKGVASSKSSGGKEEFDYTQWVVVKDLKKQRVYFRSYNDLRVRMIDMRKVSKGRKLKMAVENRLGIDIVDVSKKLHVITQETSVKTGKISHSLSELIFGAW